MIFNGKSISEITDNEIDALVQNHVGEAQHLEFKFTVNYREADDKLELLRDVVSLANGGGGYLIVGIRDDGKGNAQKYEPVKNAESVRRAIKSLCQSWISERINGLEVETRQVKGNLLVIVKVPVSERIPHMATLNSTDFWTRDHDGKRAMTIGEIGEAFRPVPNLVGELSPNTEAFSDNPDEVIWKLVIKNIGTIPAHDIQIDIYIPNLVVAQRASRAKPNLGHVALEPRNGIQYQKFTLANSPDAENYEKNRRYSGYIPKKPLFPTEVVNVIAGKLYIDRSKLIEWAKTRIIRNNEDRDFKLKVYWKIFADEAPPKSGERTLDPLSCSGLSESEVKSK